jgi:hypothetical protein
MRSGGFGGLPPFSLIFGHAVCTAAASSNHRMMRSMTAGNRARRVVYPHSANPLNVVCTNVIPTWP